MPDYNVNFNEYPVIINIQQLLLVTKPTMT